MEAKCRWGARVLKSQFMKRFEVRGRKFRTEGIP